MNKISVYGATGFIGSRFCDLYSEDTVTIRRGFHCPKSKELLYLISTTDNYNVFVNPRKDIMTNLIVLMDVLEQCKNFRIDATINFVSSWFVYGDTELPAKETAICSPKGFYSITKKCAEDLLISYCKTYEMSYRIFRLANVYGARDAYNHKKNALQWLIFRLARGNSIGLYYDGKFKRDYIHVDDVCSAMMHIMSSEYTLNQIYNIGSGIGYVFRDLINFAVERLESSCVIKEVKPPDFHNVVQVKDMYLDISKLKELEFVPNIDIETGLGEFIEHLIRVDTEDD
jgi:nucleoside-diphosphate-sugar epimerase